MAAALLVIAIGIYFVTLENRTNTSSDGDQSAVQSHRSYDVVVTSDTDNLQPGQAVPITYKITNDKKEVVKDFVVAHEKLMHFILVRKDLQNFQHLHPEFNRQTGEFTVTVTFPTDGPYRLFPDFTPGADNPLKLPVTVTYDINVGDQGRYQPVAVIPDTKTAKTAAAYKVDYYFPDELKSQVTTSYGLTASLPDEPVALESYLGAMGHSVIIKEGTLEFIHAHAGEMTNMEGMEGMTAAEHGGHQGEPDTIDFSTTFPEPGTYKIFTQFQHKGAVMTTDYVVKVN